MFRLFFFRAIIVLFIACFFAPAVQAQNSNAESAKPPIIIIPGLTGSELLNKNSKKIVWFKPQRAKDDDLRLPIASTVLTRNRDSLIVGDIIRNVQFIKFLPDVEIYERLIDALEKRGGYKEGKWDAPAKDGDQATFYVFPYDWRRDNVENARLLVQRVENLKRRLGKPNLKFNIIAHSMGGLISRYAVRFGNADLPAGNRAPRPTWAGARHFDRVFLLGTPNEGSPRALDALINGYSIFGGLNLPFVQNLSKFDSFTIPSAYQLLPFAGTFKAFDEKLEPLSIDLYNPKTWDEYGWSAYLDKGFEKKFTPAEQRSARAYFAASLRRAKRFHEALSAPANGKTPVSYYLIGGDCKDTLNAVVLLRDEKKNRWRTLFKEDSYTRSDGTKVAAEEVKKVLFAPGDGVVPKRSLTAETLMNGNKEVLPVIGDIFLCEGHTKLVTNADVQDKIFALLFGTTPTPTAAR
jgi:pimeloyl-ACP methyl ester carboxylesterase